MTLAKLPKPIVISNYPDNGKWWCGRCREWFSIEPQAHVDDESHYFKGLD